MIKAELLKQTQEAAGAVPQTETIAEDIAQSQESTASSQEATQQVLHLFNDLAPSPSILWTSKRRFLHWLRYH